MPPKRVSTFEQELASEHELGNSSAASWGRPAAAPLRPSEDLVFQQIEIDHYMSGGAPVFRLFGVTRQQNSVVCHVHGFLPYFYVPTPWQPFTAADTLHFQSVLEAALVRAERLPGGGSGGGGGQCVASAEVLLRSSIYGYTAGGHREFLRITLRSPAHVAPARRLLEEGFEFAGKATALPTYESNIPFLVRYMVDARLTGMCWVRLAGGSYRAAPAGQAASTCQWEVHADDWRTPQGLPSEGEFATLAPLRVLSFDIECVGRRGAFPDAAQDPVTQIACTVTLHGAQRPFVKAVFCLGTCSHIVGVDLRTFADERGLLLGWQAFVQECDPDLLIGYNILNFDLPYLLGRAEALRLPEVCLLGRVVGVASRCRDSVFSSRAYGTRESRTVNVEGRLPFDIMQAMQRDYKLRSYSLNSVAAEFLGEQKEDVHYSAIADLQAESADTRRRLAVYCLKDAVLPQRLMDRLMLLVNYAEMARVTGVPFSFLLARGQQIKVVSQLYRRAADESLVIPALQTDAAEEAYEGATVIEPERGFYDVPISTLDFASLYPSIMMAHNLCYTTLLSAEQAAALPAEDYERTPSGDAFVGARLRRGILPRILEDLLAARKRAKAALKAETDPQVRAVLDGRQLALKISANSVYGFTGATVGKLPCIAISQSVTAFGRAMIERTRQLVEGRFCRANGFEHDARVIYGDTDSVMVRFGTGDLGQAMALGREAAGFINGHFTRPISIDFEKVYFPYLLINKKRYAGLYWTREAGWDRLDTKGIETVRRDNCRLVQTVVDTCLRKILIDRDVAGAKAYAKQVIADLLQGRIDLHQLVITKALSKSGEDYAAKQAHVELAERMRRRDAGSAPSLGDRVAYVIVRAAKGAAAYERSEDPIYVLEHSLPIDTAYYLENQLAKPLMRLFEPIMAHPEEILTGDHTRIVHVPEAAAGGSGMGAFVRRAASCLGCKSALAGSAAAPPVCAFCRGRVFEVYHRQVARHNDLEASFARLWSQCQRCQGDVHHDVLCTSRDCPIFYMRRTVQKDLAESAQVLGRFPQGSEW